MMTVTELQRAGGSVAVYYAAKGACLFANAQRQRRKLWKNTRKLMKQYFPDLKLNDVRFCIHSNLPPNWFESPLRVEGMTFGDTIFLKGTDYQKTRAGLATLMHELFHVDQVRRHGGEMGFAVAYGEGFLKGGNYSKNPMETAAVNFVEANRASLPEGVKKEKGDN
jgi:hypothetical protein